MNLATDNREDLHLPPRLLIRAYIVWLVTCILFFAMGVGVGRLSLPAFVETRHVQAVKPSPPAEGQTEGERLAAGAANGANYAVQVTVVSTAGEANQIVADLRRKGFTSAFISLPADAAAARLYSVRVGFYNLPVANLVAEELQRDLGFRNARVVNN